MIRAYVRENKGKEGRMIVFSHKSKSKVGEIWFRNKGDELLLDMLNPM